MQGRQYRLSRYSRRLLREYLAWVDQVAGNPLEDIAAGYASLPLELQALALKTADRLAKQRGSVYSDAFSELWVTAAGQCVVLALLLRQHHPDLTAQDVEELYLDGCQEHGEGFWLERFITAVGRMPVTETDLQGQFYQELGLLPAATGPAKPQKESWLEIDKTLLKEFHLRPQELEELTLTEVLVYASSLSEKQPMLKSEVQAMRQIYFALTPEQRLELYLRTSQAD